MQRQVKRRSSALILPYPLSCLYNLSIQNVYTVQHMPKTFKAFRFNPELYNNFKQLVSASGYTVTGALEKFMTVSVENGILTFPTARSLDYEAQAKILLAWYKQGQYWYVGEDQEEISIPGRLLTLLPLIHSAELKAQIEKALTKPKRKS